MLVALTACTPSYTYTAFICGSAADGARCPDDQACIYGRCRRTSADAGDGIICGTGSNTMNCAQTQQCCVNATMHPFCEDAALTCPVLGALCDSKADCTRSGDHCCDLGSIITCDTECDVIVCETDRDCATGRPKCCAKTDDTRLDTDPYWGTCRESCSAGEMERT
jgi:hypothetical protein